FGGRRQFVLVAGLTRLALWRGSCFVILSSCSTGPISHGTRPASAYMYKGQVAAQADTNRQAGTVSLQRRMYTARASKPSVEMIVAAVSGLALISPPMLRPIVAA